MSNRNSLLVYYGSRTSSYDQYSSIKLTILDRKQFIALQNIHVEQSYLTIPCLIINRKKNSIKTCSRSIIKKVPYLRNGRSEKTKVPSTFTKTIKLLYKK